MTQDLFRSQFRLPYPLYEGLKAAAERNGRSLNSELVNRLERSLDGDELGFTGDLLDVIGLHALATSMFAKMVDRSKFDADELAMLNQFEAVADKIARKLHFSKAKDQRHVVELSRGEEG